MNNKMFILIFSFLFLSCQDEQENPADAIVDKAIEVAGGEKYENANIEFIFREGRFTSQRKDGIYEFTRLQEDSLGVVKDVLDNEGLERFREGKKVKLSDSLASSIAESVNSVHYFVQLPFGLAGDAVQKKLLGEDTINGKEYYEIEVTFRQEGGGKDHEDIYVYWIQKGDFTVDFLAYRFFVNEGGIRFRKAVNPRVINGIRFVDYENYKTEDLSTPLQKLDELYEEGKLTKVSQIENEILKVEIED